MSALPSPLSGPETVPFAPKAIGVILIQQPEYDQTVITRDWRPGDCARCRLCPKCGANANDTCTVIAPGLIDVASALTYRFPRGS